MKKTTLLLLTTLILLGGLGVACDDDDPPATPRIPNPGFAIVATRLEGSRERPLRGAVTDGQLVDDADNASGNVIEFGNLVHGNSGQANVDGGRAPGFWRFLAKSNWDDCTGDRFSGGIERGALNYFVCRDIFLFLGAAPTPGMSSQLSPGSIDGNAGAVEFMAYAEGASTTYGMPTFQFINEYGTLVAQTQATAVGPAGDNWLKGWSGCLAGLPTGSYGVRIINATPDGAGQRIGGANVYLYGGPVQKAIDDPSFFVRQQYIDFLGREPDAGGWEFWSGQITQCGTDAACIQNKRIDVSRAFWYSTEFLQYHPGLRNPDGVWPDFNNAEFVRLCFVTYLQRDPDQGGYDQWLSYLNSTGDYNGVINGFIASAEYRTRFDPPEPTLDPLPEPEPCQPCYAYMECMVCNAY